MSRSVDPQKLVSETLMLIGPLIEEKQQTLTLDFAPDIPRQIAVDPLRMKQALGNLLSNANKYSPAGTNITVAVSVSSEPSELRIAVEDEGPGIAADAMDFILKPFERADFSGASDIPGTGLGLPIAKKLIEQHAGRLEIHSRPGVGTRFLICLTLTLDKPRREISQNENEPPALAVTPHQTAVKA